MTGRVLARRLRDDHAGGVSVLEGPEGHHLARVSRVRVGDPVVLFDGSGTECAATVRDVHGDRVVLALGVLRAGVCADTAGVVWIQGIPKGDKLDTIVRQATELGVRAVWPVYTTRSVPRPRGTREEARKERLTRVAEEAARQCGRADVPTVALAQTLADALATLDGDPPGLRIVAWEGAVTPLTVALREQDPRAGPCAVLAGPEGGLDVVEILALQHRGFLAVSLGPRILRAETVAPAMLGALGVLIGDLALR